MTFRVGQKVVCVGGDDPFPNVWSDIKTNVTTGHIYTVRDVDISYVPFYGCAGIRVEEEFIDPINYKGELIEPAILAIHFRPVVEKQTDISIFTALLNTKQRENALCGNGD
jgi:hypothetical protein